MKQNKFSIWWKSLPKYAVALILSAVILVGFFGLVLGGANIYFRAPIANYYKNSEKAFLLPGLNEGLVHQGMYYNAETDLFYITGYDKDHGASPIYVVNQNKNQTVKRVYMLNEDGSAFTGHSGGIIVENGFIYIAGSEENCIHVFNYTDLENATDKANIKCVGRISLQVSETDYISPAFIAYTPDGIITGEFVNDKGYAPVEDHIITTKAGDRNRAVAVLLPFDDSAPFKYSQTPSIAYSMPDQVQGFLVDGNNIYLSTSYGLAFSKIYKHDVTKANLSTISLLGENLSTYELDSASLIKEYKTPPMAEQMVKYQDKFYILTESASGKYIFGKFVGGRHCYATDFNNMK